MSQFDINKFLVENKITTNSKIIKESLSPHDYDKKFRKHDSTKYRRQEDKKAIEHGSRLSNPFEILDAVHKFNSEYMKDKVEFTDQIGDSIGARATIQWDPTSTFGNEDEVEEVHYEMMDYIKNDPYLKDAMSVLDSVGGKAVFWVTSTMDESLNESVLPDVIKGTSYLSDDTVSITDSFDTIKRLGGNWPKFMRGEEVDVELKHQTHNKSFADEFTYIPNWDPKAKKYEFKIKG